LEIDSISSQFSEEKRFGHHVGKAMVNQKEIIVDGSMILKKVAFTQSRHVTENYLDRFSLFKTRSLRWTRISRRPLRHGGP
jgi:hypothetical protein